MDSRNTNDSVRPPLHHPLYLQALYAIYHGPQGLKNIAIRIHKMALSLASGTFILLFAYHFLAYTSSSSSPLPAAKFFGHHLEEQAFFDTLKIRPGGMLTREQILVRVC